MSSAPPLRILYVSACWPLANGVGAQKRSFVAANALHRLGDVVYFEAPPALHDVERPPSSPHAWESLFQACAFAPALLATGGDVWSSFLSPGFLKKLLCRAWITAGAMMPLSATQNKALLAHIQSVCGLERFDVIYVFQAHAALFMQGVVDSLLKADGVSVFDWDAAERPAAADQSRARNANGPLVTLGRWLNDRKLAGYEQTLLRQASVTVCASEFDVSYFRSQHSSTEVRAIPNCIDIPDKPPEPVETLGAPVVLFVGLLNYWPNTEGVLLFLKEIWPKVRQRFPDAVFNIVGRGVTASIQQWHGQNGVNVIGEVEQVAPHYAHCSVAVAPMFFSVGSSIKILESLAFGRTLVAFEAATCRHGLLDGTHISVAHNTDEFAHKLIGLLENPARAMAMAESGRAFVKQHYAREAAEQLTQEIVTAALLKQRP